jgi:hypothetical protein
MSDYVLFQMWGSFRQSLIAGHLFYVEQARKRLLSQFENIETEADKAAEDWLEQSQDRFDPDRHDPGEFHEAAHDAGIEFYRLLSDMRDHTRLSLVAGMFHEWDKQLREWLIREIGHWHNGGEVAQKIWSANFTQLAELFESVGWLVSGSNCFLTLDACRLVVNVYKHGEGSSLEYLKQKYPEYLENPFEASGDAFSGMKYRNYTHLKVRDDHIQV